MDKIQIGISALEYIQKIPNNVWSKFDTIILDPPYFDKNNEKDKERVNQRSKMNGSSTVQWNDAHTRLMDSELREDIYNYIRDRISENCYIVHFHTDPSRVKIENLACEHIWVKPIHYTIAGNADRNNGEHILIEGPKIKGKPKGRILNKYIYGQKALFSKLEKYDNYKPNGSNHIPRACAKPFSIYNEIYRHLDSKFILDPFSGFGMSIKAAITRGAVIYACDFDPTLQYEFINNVKKQSNIDEFFDSSILKKQHAKRRELN